MALTLTDDQATQLLASLGLPDDTDDPQLVLATAVDLASQVAEVTKPSAVAAAAKRVGMEVIDTDTLTALRAEATECRQVKAAAALQKIEAAVDDALRKGKITPGRRKHWVTLIQADPAMADVLASVPDETAMNLTEIGHGVDGQDGSNPATQGAGGWFYG